MAGGSRGRRPPPAARLAALLLLGLIAVLAVATASASAPARPSEGLGAGEGPRGAAGPVTVSGTVVDAYSGTPLANVTVGSYDSAGTFRTTVTDARGAFSVPSLPGPDYLTVNPPNGYAGVQLSLLVGNTSLTGVRLSLTPTGLIGRLNGPGVLDAPVLLGFGAAGLVGTLGAVAAVRSRRVAEGKDARILSRFGRYVVVRAAMIPGQLVTVLVVLFVFGSYLPALAQSDRSGCLRVNGSACASCPPSTIACQVSVFGSGLGQFLFDILTGQWGIARFGNLRLPAVDMIVWWLPNSLELAAVALALSIAIGYPLGLAAGWRFDGLLDRSLRGVSITLLLVPTFLVVVFLINGTYVPFLHAFGDSPFGLLPSLGWFLTYGYPSWFHVTFSQTTPTGFPLVDGVLHGDWPFVGVVAAKLLVQAVAIAIIYVSIFFRFARHAIAEASRSEAIRAARARGVPEATLAWRHAGRRVLPVLLLVFGTTLPAYVGTQALVEVLFNDSPGFGTILFSEMSQVGQSGFGVLHSGPIPTGNLYQVTILFLALLLLVSNLCTDVLARFLDHSLDAPEDR